MQLALALTAAVCTTVVLPSLLLARGLLVGGKIAVASSVGLSMSTLVELLDGYRALIRKPNESPIRLSLKSMFFLMTFGGLAFAWIGASVFFHDYE